MGAPPHDIADLRARLAGGRGPRCGAASRRSPTRRRSGISSRPSSRPRRGSPTGPDRRQFLRLMAASFAMAGLAGLRRTTDGAAQGGALCPQSRADRARRAARLRLRRRCSTASPTASLVTDPQRPSAQDRGQRPSIPGAAAAPTSSPRPRSSTSTIPRARRPCATSTGSAPGRRSAAPWRAASRRCRPTAATGLRLLTGPVTSPSLLAQIAAHAGGLSRRCSWHSHAAGRRARPLDAATDAAFGRGSRRAGAFDKARVVVAIDGDFLDPGPHQVGAVARLGRGPPGRGGAGRLLDAACRRLDAEPDQRQGGPSRRARARRSRGAGEAGCRRPSRAADRRRATTRRRAWLRRARRGAARRARAGASCWPGRRSRPRCRRPCIA